MASKWCWTPATLRISAPITFRITDATAAEALRALEAATDSFLIPGERPLLMVARDNRAETHRTDAGDGAWRRRFPSACRRKRRRRFRRPCSRRWRSAASVWTPVKRVVYFRDTVPKALGGAPDVCGSLARARADRSRRRIGLGGPDFQSQLWPAAAQVPIAIVHLTSRFRTCCRLR